MAKLTKTITSLKGSSAFLRLFITPSHYVELVFLMGVSTFCLDMTIPFAFPTLNSFTFICRLNVDSRKLIHFKRDYEMIRSKIRVFGLVGTFQSLVHFSGHLVEVLRQESHGFSKIISFFFLNLLWFNLESHRSLPLFLIFFKRNFKGMKRANQFLNLHGFKVLCFSDSSRLICEHLWESSQHLSYELFFRNLFS